VYTQFGPLDDAEQQRKRYCQWKAVEIRRSLREGAPYQRGGFGEENTAIEGPGVAVGVGNDVTGAPTPAAAAAAAAPSSLPTLEDMYPAPSGERDYSMYAMPERAGRGAAAKHTPAAKPAPAPAPTPAPAPAHAPAHADASSSSSSSSHSPSPQTHASTSAPAPSGVTSLSTSSVTIVAQAGPRAAAMTMADKLCKHACSAMQFDDAKTAVAKLSQAIALMLPHIDE
jgi:hypothetical protein